MSAVIRFSNETVTAGSALFAVAIDPPAKPPRNGRSIAISRAWSVLGVLVRLLPGQYRGYLALVLEARSAISVVLMPEGAVL
jgi:hypothetical protein